MTKAIDIQKEQKAVLAAVILHNAGRRMTYEELSVEFGALSESVGPVDMEDVMRRFPEVVRVADNVYKYVDKPRAYSTAEMIQAAQHEDVYECVGGDNAFLGKKVRRGRSGIMWITGFMAGELLAVGDVVLGLVWKKEQ